MITVVTNSVVETQTLAEAIGKVVRGGEILELVSDVGGGKTTFTKGLARGMEIDEVVQSPTFTISRLYKARDGLELHHFDFYRLSEAGLVAAELAESLAQTNAVVVVEWGEIVHDVFPAERITVRISSPSEEQRQLNFTIPARNEQVLTAIAAFKEGQKTA